MTLRPVLGSMRGITRRTADDTQPDGYRYTWAIQQLWRDIDTREPQWRDLPVVNAWELPPDDKDHQR